MKGDGYLLRELRRVKPKLVVFGHAHDGYGEDMLMHDGVQSAYEDIILQRSGVLFLLDMFLDGRDMVQIPTRSATTENDKIGQRSHCAGDKKQSHKRSHCIRNMAPSTPGMQC